MIRDNYTDIHMHVIPGVDDGARDLEEALQMLEISYRQGVRRVIATPHDDYHRPSGMAGIAPIRRQFELLAEAASARYAGLELRLGCEVQWKPVRISDRLRRAEICTMDGSGCVLVEFEPGDDPDLMRESLFSVLDEGFQPILAHTERYRNLAEERDMIRVIREKGVLLQINAYSLVMEQKHVTKGCARWLVENELADFLGSDAHGIKHRPPEMRSGIEYLRRHCSESYFDALVSLNAGMIFEKRPFGLRSACCASEKRLQSNWRRKPVKQLETMVKPL